MKTQTRGDIIRLIEKHGKIRPHDLRLALKLSGPAIHKQLRNLTKQGLIEVKGKPPLTFYALAGVPNLEEVSKWLSAKALKTNPVDAVCETRDVFAGRLPRLEQYVREGLPNAMLPLVISSAGEIGNNSFDHNIGQWRDVPGCWFESQVSGQQLWICIADRGQGIFKSLAKNHPDLKNDQTAVKAAFETIISGRAPERRGNGLKFVRAMVLRGPASGIACISGTGIVRYGMQGRKCAALLERRL